MKYSATVLLQALAWGDLLALTPTLPPPEAVQEYHALMQAMVLGSTIAYSPRGTPSRGKARDTKADAKPRKKERRSARHTQRRRR